MAAQPNIVYTLEADPRQLAELEALAKQAPKLAQRASVRAVNRATSKANTLTIRAITRHMNVKRKDIVPKISKITGRLTQTRSGQVRKTKATFANPIGKVTVTGRRIALSRFGARGGKRGVSYKISKAHGRKRIPDAFMGQARKGRGKRKKWEAGVKLFGQTFYETFRGGTGTAAEVGTSGHVGVFKRLGKTRLPIRELRGPSIPHVAETLPALKRALDVDVMAVFENRMDHEIGRMLEKLAKRKAG